MSAENQYRYFDTNINVDIVEDHIRSTNPDLLNNAEQTICSSIASYYKNLAHSDMSKTRAIDVSLDWKHYYHLLLMRMESI